MCNNVHQINEEIKNIGKGWKLVSKINNNACFFPIAYESYNGWITWNSGYNSGDGFCFFLTRSEARRCLKHLKNPRYWGRYDNIKIKRIEYLDGLCKQIEPNLIIGKIYVMALCKKFRFID